MGEEGVRRSDHTSPCLEERNRWILVRELVEDRAHHFAAGKVVLRSQQRHVAMRGANSRSQVYAAFNVGLWQSGDSLSNASLTKGHTTTQ
jgi:hypothetical protein